MAARKRRKKSRELTIQDLDALFERAEGGDVRAEAQVRKEVAKLAKRANRQFRTLEVAGVSSASFERAQYYLSEEKGTTRFRERTKTQNLTELQEDAAQIMAFIRSGGYTKKAAQLESDQIENISSALTAALGEMPDEYIIYQINEMFRTDAWKEFKKSHGRSTDLIQTAQDAFTRGRSVDDMIAAYDEYTQSRDESFDIVQAWTKWTGGDWFRK